ncbi:MAG: DUF222 domain-containing protein [Vicinamibacterales bacterium]|nr:DUF222 domain-containing protein [Vicinamibacterales bacterium]
MTRVATPETEERLLTFARSGTAAQVERLTRAWRRVDRIAAAEDDRRQHEGRCVRTWVDEDGMLVIRGRLSPELGAVVQRALEGATERVYQDATRVEHGPGSETPREDPSPSATTAQRRADALGLLAESALAADLDRAATGDRYQVVVHVETDALKTDSEAGQAVLDDGVRVSAETSRRMACDAGTVVMQHDQSGTVLDVGRKTRTIPPAIRRALASAPTWTDARLSAAGIEIDRDTAKPDWHGESLDLPWAIAVIHPGPATAEDSDVPAGTSSFRTGVATCSEDIVGSARWRLEPPAG